MSNPEDNTARQKALALAALAHGLSTYRMTETAYGVWVENKERSAAAAILGGGWCAGMGDTQIEALAAAAEALGLEPDPAVQQQEQTPPRAVESIALKPAAATPLTLHRTMGEARGLIQTAIGQVRDLNLPHVGEYLWGASHELDRAVGLIRHALSSILAPVLAPKESTPEPDPPIEQFEPMLKDWTPDPQEGGAQP